MKDENINGEVFIDFLKQLIQGRQCPLILWVDHAIFHSSKAVRNFVRAHRSQLRLFFLPKRAPELNPDEQVGNEIKAISKNEYTQIAQDFCSFSRRKKGRIVSI